MKSIHELQHRHALTQKGYLTVNGISFKCEALGVATAGALAQKTSHHKPFASAYVGPNDYLAEKHQVVTMIGIF